MKKAFLQLVLLVFLAPGYMLAQDYTLSAFSEPYSDIASPISVNDGLIWDDPSYLVPIGFDFTFLDVTFNELKFDGDDGFLLGNSITSPDSAVGFILNGLDMVDRAFDLGEGEPGSLSPISYQTTGTAGNRIFVLEYKNVGFFDDGYDNSGVYEDFANIQLWFYEEDGAVEYRFGESSLTNLQMIYESYNYDFFAIYAIGITDQGGDFITASDILSIEGMGTNVMFGDLQNYGSFLDANIPDGTVYRIAGMTSSNTELNGATKTVQVSPNPTSGLLQIITNIADENIRTVQIMNNNGQTLQTYENLNNIDISNLPAAGYILQINTTEGVWNERIVKF
ncbi:MAG: T9SS type A sorting domain-containing protein [Saprospiraceae bacterium]